MTVVMIAMNTISVNSRVSSTPSCNPTCRMTISVSPRVFISTPSAAAWRCGTCERTGGGQRAEELAADRHDEDQQQLDHAGGPDAADVHLEADGEVRPD